MILIAPQACILAMPQLLKTNTDLDQLIGIVRNTADVDPFSGTMFVFRNDDGTTIEILAYDGQGFTRSIKRFSSIKIDYWPSTSKPVLLFPHDLQILLWGQDPTTMKRPEMWRPIQNDPKSLVAVLDP